MQNISYEQKIEFVFVKRLPESWTAIERCLLRAQHVYRDQKTCFVIERSCPALAHRILWWIAASEQVAWQVLQDVLCYCRACMYFRRTTWHGIASRSLQSKGINTYLRKGRVSTSNPLSKWSKSIQKYLRGRPKRHLWHRRAQNKPGKAKRDRNRIYRSRRPWKQMSTWKQHIKDIHIVFV